MRIPKLAHWIWFQEDLPDWAAHNVTVFRRLHPRWQFRIWHEPPGEFPDDLRDLIDHLPWYSSRSDVFCKALDKLRILEALALETATQRLESDELERKMTAALKNLEPALMSGDSSGNSPASSAYTPARSRSGNSSGWPTPGRPTSGATRRHCSRWPPTRTAIPKRPARSSRAISIPAPAPSAPSAPRNQNRKSTSRF